MRTIDADELKTVFPPGEMVKAECVRATIDHMPTVKPEITENDVIEYCRKRCLVVVTRDFYNEMIMRRCINMVT